MHVDVITRFINALVVMMSPICPHWSEHIWGLLGKKQAQAQTMGDAQTQTRTEGTVQGEAQAVQYSSINHTSWPVYTPYDRDIRKQYLFFCSFMKNVRQLNLKTKVTGTVKHLQVYISSVFEPKKG